MIRIAVVDNDESYVKKLTEYLKRYQQTCEEKFEITVYPNGDGITAGYKAQFDIIFMDIQKEFMDGMAAAKEIREKDSEVVIIFITNNPQYAVKGYETGVSDYILKPASYSGFSQKFTQAVARFKEVEERGMIIQTKDGAIRFNVSDIQYIESYDHDLIFHVDDKDFVSNMTMKAIEKKLENDNFSRGNHCYLINLEHVEGIEDGCAVIKRKKLQLSRSRKNEFINDLKRYWGDYLKI